MNMNPAFQMPEQGAPSFRCNKVPAVTLAFWAIKIMATTVGETAADFLNTNLNLGLTSASLLIGVLLLAALIVQMLKCAHGDVFRPFTGSRWC